MAMDENEKRLAAALKEIQETSPKVALNINNVEDYLTKLERKVGTTEDLDCAGYILPNGKFLDLSLKNVFEEFDKVLSHNDMIYFGFDPEDILDAGVIRLGECVYEDFYFVEINMMNFKPTKKQYEAFDTILMKEPNKLCIEARMSKEINNKFNTNFVKMYNFLQADTSKNIQNDLNNYEKGDKTYAGCLDERTGEEIRPDK